MDLSAPLRVHWQIHFYLRTPPKHMGEQHTREQTAVYQLGDIDPAGWAVCSRQTDRR